MFTDISRLLLESIAVSLNLDPNYLIQYHNNYDHTFELKHYEPLQMDVNSRLNNKYKHTKLIIVM